MKASKVRLLALILAGIMSLSLLASCTSGGENETDESETKQESSESSTTNDENSDSSAETDKKDEGDSSELPLPSLIEGENAPLIEYANSLANGVNAYYTDTNRTGFHFYNKNVSVTCDLNDTKVVSSITNKSGQNYIENTMDVFIKMTNGDTYYASNSSDNGIANIFKLGYYYYENRIEGQSFTDPYIFDDPNGKAIDHTSISRYNQCKGVVEDGVLKVTVTNNQDPWFSFGQIKYKASDFNIIALTMKVDTQFSTNMTVYMNAGDRSGVDSTSFSDDQHMGFDIQADGEYHTYYIPVYYIDDYTGRVSGLRLDFMPTQGAMDAQIEISDMRLLNATISDGPSEVYLNRMFNTYSDKLHQTIQIAALHEVSNVQMVGMITDIAADNVSKIVIKDRNGLHYSLDDKIAWNHVSYVGFDTKSAGVIGFILPYDGSGGSIKVTLEGDVYRIEQSKAPDNWTLTPSPEGTRNAKDIYFGHRIYTDTTHSFDKFIAEAELEINPLTAENFEIDSEASTFGEFIKYDGLRGSYMLSIDGSGGFGPPYKLHQNRQYNVTFNLKGDGVNDRLIYVVARYDGGGALECAALLDGKQMMLPVPLEVGKNFGEGGDSPIFCTDDAIFSETILPLVAAKDTDSTYSIVNLYYNWGKYPLKQISYIQYYSPYYHLSTGVHESNCIIPYYFTQWADTLNMLPDHRPMSGPFWDGDPQHTYCGTHSFLQYTDADGSYYASENIKDTIGSYGPIYADVTMDFISDDGKIKVTYNHMEFPQTDENRAFYEMKYEILEDVSFNNFAKDFSFYSVKSLDPKGLYTKVGYLDENNVSQVATASMSKDESISYVLGDNCPYFSFFDMPNCGDPRGYNNLSFLIYKASFKIEGKSADPSFILNNDYTQLSLSLDLGEVTLKAGDSITIYAIIMPWQYYDVYDATEPDQNVRRVRENTLLNPLTLTAGENCEKMESVFLPKARTTNGKSAEFTLSGGHNNVPVRIYGFDKLTVPVVEEKINGEWVPVDLSSFSTPDNFGYGYYYDGYGVYYDGDGTYSYSFITTMDNGAPRTFRVTATDDFEGWPEIEKVPDPMNFWLDSQDLNAAFVTASNRFGTISMLSEDGVNFVRVNRNGKDSEATLPLFENAEGALAGRYLVFKVRAPQGTASKIGTWEFYTSTEHTMYDADGNILIVGEDYRASGTSLADGSWHVVVIDLVAYGKSDSFKLDEDGNYYIQYLRFDAFNIGNATDAIIDIAYVGLHDSLDEILEYNKDMNTVAYFETPSYFEYRSTLNNEALNLHFDASELQDMIGSFAVRFHDVTLSDDRDYLRLTGSVGAEAIVELFHKNTTPTGQYVVIKYRMPKENPGKIGYWQFYTFTEGEGAASSNSYTAEGVGSCVIADDEWQVLILDLEAFEKTEGFKKNEAGEYVLKYFRFDFFNSQYGNNVYYDLEYLAFSDSLEEICELNSDMSFVTLCTGPKETQKIDPKTGNEITE